MKSSAINQAAYYALGIVMMKGVSLLMIPYVTRQLSPTEYGTLEILLIFADISTLIIGFGLVEALNRYVGLSAENRGESQTLISQCFTLAIFVCILVMVLLYFSASSIISLLPAQVSTTQLYLIAFPALLEGVIAIPLTLMRMQSLAKYFCLLNVIKAVLQAVMVIVLLQLDYGIDAILIAGAASSLFLVLCLLPYQWQQMDKDWYSRWYRSWYNNGFNSDYWHKMFEIMRYGGPIVLGRLGLFAMTGLDRWLLADKVGIEQLAVYAIAVKFAMILALLMQPFGLWWFPYRFTLLKQQDGKSQCAHYAMLGTNLGLILGFIMLLTLPTFMQLILPTAYHDATLIVMALLAVNMIKHAGDLLNLGCFINSSMSQMWVQWLCAIIAIIGYVLFIEDYGVWAAAAVLFFVYLLRLVLFYFYSQHVLHLPYQHRTWLLTLILGGFALGTFYLGLQPLLSEPLAAMTLLMGFVVSAGLSLMYLAALIFYKVLPNPLMLWQQRQAKVVTL
jgi:O-antigen/teichoic acid export membrane protein